MNREEWSNGLSYAWPQPAFLLGCPTFPSSPSPLSHIPSLLLQSSPHVPPSPNPAGDLGSAERCKLPAGLGPGRSHGRKRILTHLQFSKRMSWQHLSFGYVQHNANDCVLFFGICCSIADRICFVFSQHFAEGFQPVTPLKYGRDAPDLSLSRAWLSHAMWNYVISYHLIYIFDLKYKYKKNTQTWHQMNIAFSGCSNLHAAVKNWSYCNHIG